MIQIVFRAVPCISIIYPSPLPQLSLSLSLNLLKMNEVVSMCLVLHSFMVHVSFPDIDPVYAHEPTEIG